MADALGIGQSILDFAVKIKSMVEKFRCNPNDCRRILKLLGTVCDVVEGLKTTPNIMEDKMMSQALKGLEEALEHSRKLVLKCQRKNAVRRFIDSKDIADTLSQVYQEISVNLSAAVLANGAYNTLMLAKITKILNALPHHLKQEVDRLVQTYRHHSTECDSYKKQHKRETKKTDVARLEAKNEKENAAADSKVQPASITDGSAKSTSVERVTGQGSGPSIVTKDSSHISNPTDGAGSSKEKKSKIKKIEVPNTARSEVKIKKTNVQADTKGSCASSPDGAANSTSLKGQAGPSIVNKDSSHISNPTDGAGSSKEKKSKIKKIEVPNTARSEVKIKKTNVQADTKGSCASSPDGAANSTSLKGQAGPSIVNKSVAVSAGPYQLQKIINIPGVPGETGSYKIISRSTENMTPIKSLDVHPAKPWIVTGHVGGNVSIWDYLKQKTVMELQVNKVPGKFARWIHDKYRYIHDTPAAHCVCSAKFIITKQEEWLLVGDGGGNILVYTYTGTKLSEFRKFEAHRGESIDTLAVHPTEPYLLSSSAFGGTVKLWNWSEGWKESKEYDVKPWYPHGVVSLKFNPRDTNTFACVTKDRRVKVGNITTSGLTTKLNGPFAAVYPFTGSDGHLMVTLSFTSHFEVTNQIRDSETGEVVDTLDVSGHQTCCIAAHPTLPILATALDDGTICFWDANTYRLLKRAHVTDSGTRNLTFVPGGTNGITRLVVTSDSKIAIIEVNFPMANTNRRIGGGTNYG